jgi:hypothetical protein
MLQDFFIGKIVIFSIIESKFCYKTNCVRLVKFRNDLFTTYSIICGNMKSMFPTAIEFDLSVNFSNALASGLVVRPAFLLALDPTVEEEKAA